MSSELARVYRESQEIASDEEYSAKPLLKEAYVQADKMISLLPSQFPAPEISPEPDGRVGFEWYVEKGLSLVISVGADNTIYYAGRFGNQNKANGSERFKDAIPKAILDNLTRLFASNA